LKNQHVELNSLENTKRTLAEEDGSPITLLSRSPLKDAFPGGPGGPGNPEGPGSPGIP